MVNRQSIFWEKGDKIMTVNFVIIGKRIRELRKRCSLSQAQLAEKADLSTQYVSQIETAKKHVSLNALVKIANVLDVSLDAILLENQKSARHAYQSDVYQTMEDCTRFEKRVISGLINAVVPLLRESVGLLDFLKE